MKMEYILGVLIPKEKKEQEDEIFSGLEEIIGLPFIKGEAYCAGDGFIGSMSLKPKKRKKGTLYFFKVTDHFSSYWKPFKDLKPEYDILKEKIWDAVGKEAVPETQLFRVTATDIPMGFEIIRDYTYKKIKKYEK